MLPPEQHNDVLSHIGRIVRQGCSRPDRWSEFDQDLVASSRGDLHLVRAEKVLFSRSPTISGRMRERHHREGMRESVCWIQPIDDDPGKPERPCEALAYVLLDQDRQSRIPTPVCCGGSNGDRTRLINSERGSGLSKQ